MKKIILTSLITIVACITNAQTVGLFTQTTGSLDGYVLFAPTQSDTAYLIDKCGKKIHQWSCPRKPGLSVYLLPDGSLLRTENKPNPTFNSSGATGGIIAKYDWNSNLLWSDTISSNIETQNHDVCPLPNGNIIIAVWEKYTGAQAIAQGRDSSLTGASVWSAKLLEIQPTGTSGGTIVWQWNLFDHLIQDFDAGKPNFGVVSDHPELMNINFIGTDTATQVDWTHLNAVTYNESRDQVMFSFHNLSEIYIIDHSTTTAQAASHTGGAHGKGGDFLYRWGNPQSYNRGTNADRKLFQQHNPTWIPAGYPDANKIMIFNNGVGRLGGNAASVDIISPPVDMNGDYTIAAGLAFGPTTTDWNYMATNPSSFFTQVMGGAQRLVNGNTLICEATKGHFFEIDSTNTIVWDYKNPVGINGPVAQGTTTTTKGAFRCIYYPANYSGFVGQTLTAGNPIELNPLPYVCPLMVGGVNETQTISQNIHVVNPFNNLIILSADTDLLNSSVTLMDITGRTISEFTNLNILKNASLSIDVKTNLAPGIYILNVKSTTQNFTTRLIHQND